jgi:prepilin-type N-terminal cleavage/methylation domain-containing protein
MKANGYNFLFVTLPTGGHGAARPAAGAFTLIELLVVISIISVLLTLLIPGLGLAMDLARSASCRSNLRTVSIALGMYLNESQGGFPPCVVTNPAKPWVVEAWPYRLAKYAGMEGQDKKVNGHYAEGTVYVCPADDDPTAVVHADWHAYTSSYNANYWHQHVDSNTNQGRRMEDVNRPATLVYFAEPHRSWIYSLQWSSFPERLSPAHAKLDVNDWLEIRHPNERQNLIMTDLHIEQRPVDEISYTGDWDGPWRTAWEPQP